MAFSFVDAALDGAGPSFHVLFFSAVLFFGGEAGTFLKTSFLDPLGRVIRRVGDVGRSAGVDRAAVLLG